MTQSYRYIGQKRRTQEDGRFIRGKGRFVADIKLPDMAHMAVLQSPYPCARIKHIDVSEAQALDGVLRLLTGAELAQSTEPIANALATPGVIVYPLAVDRVRYVGEWVVAVVAESRAIAEDALELIRIDYEQLDFVIDPEQALYDDSPVVHPEHGSNVLYQRSFVWGDVEQDFAKSSHQQSLRVRWGRSATVPIETFGVLVNWDAGSELFDIWASIQMPSFTELTAAMLRQPVNALRAHYDVDVGGSYGVKRGIKHTVIAAWLSRDTGRPVRMIEDRLENMSGGDMHGPDRIFDIKVAFEDDGTVTSLALTAIDDTGAQSGRAPMQLGKPVGAIVGPYQIKSVAYEAICVSTNKCGQTAVRGFGQSPTNVALEAAMDRVARALNMQPLEIRRRNLIKKDQFPWRIPSGSLYDSGDYHTVVDKALATCDWPQLEIRRQQARDRADTLSGIGISTTLEPGGGNAAFEPLLNPANDATTWPESCVLKIDRQGAATAMISTPSSGQGHETLVATIIGEQLGLEPSTIRVIHLDTLSGMPTNTPVASRMAIMLGGAASGAAKLIHDRVLLIAAHLLDASADSLELKDGFIRVKTRPDHCISFKKLAFIANRKDDLMPDSVEPGLQATYVWQVPGGGVLPDKNGVVQMYPCYSFATHIVRVEIDTVTGKVTIPEYTIGHDCGTVINPDIVRGMVIGGAAHGIGAALYEKFDYDEGGQLLAGNFADYLIPSVHEIPDILLCEHATPSPLTSHGQKGVGEGGYLGAPAAIACAVNDALSPLGLERWELPLKPAALADMIPAAQSLGAMLGP